MNEQAVRAAFVEQAGHCEQLGSPLTARLLRTMAAVLDRSTATGRRILDWRGDPSGGADSVPLRLAGALHALARSGAAPELNAAYATGNVAPLLMRRVLIEHDAVLLPWLESPPQTNEVGRSAAIMAGLLVLAAERGLPFELVELGASAGLNLNLDRFGYRLGETRAGDPQSAVQLVPRWEGGSPPSAQVRVVQRRAVDQAPVRVGRAPERERLIAYVWPDQVERLRRIEAALAVAAEHPPALEQGDAAEFVERVLKEPQERGVLRAVYHTIFWNYLPIAAQARVIAGLERAGARADQQRPLAWLRYELTGDGAVAALDLTSWPGGATRRLATGHPHVTTLRWLAD